MSAINKYARIDTLTLEVKAALKAHNPELVKQALESLTKFKEEFSELSEPFMSDFLASLQDALREELEGFEASKKFEKVLDGVKKLGAALNSLSKKDKVPMEQTIAQFEELKKEYAPDHPTFLTIQELIDLAKEEVRSHV